MSSSAKALIPAIVVASMMGSAIFGLKMREAKELPETMKQSSTLLVSKENQIEIDEADYFSAIVDLLKAKYVDPVADDDKLLSGAVKGLIMGLRDVDSQFFNPKEFEALKSIRAGSYTGIGVWLDYKSMKSDLKLEGNPEEIMVPRLAVVSVAPGSPADQAGIKVGDVLDSVDGHWVTNSEEILKYRKAQADFLAKKIDFKVINDLRKELRKKVEKSVTPFRAREKATTGVSGEVETTWFRDGKPLKTVKLQKKLTDANYLLEKDGALVLGFNANAPAALTAYLKGKSEVTIDLRHNILGEQETMRKCLEIVAKPGSYGFLVSDRNPVTLEVKKGNPNPPKVKLLVDASTRDAAEIFALALSSQGAATLSGGTTGGKPKVREMGQLSDGSGYVIVSSAFSMTKEVATKKGATK
jgi:carboxyl-terminal processing protease